MRSFTLLGRPSRPAGTLPAWRAGRVKCRAQLGRAHARCQGGVLAPLGARRQCCLRERGPQLSTHSAAFLKRMFPGARTPRCGGIVERVAHASLGERRAPSPRRARAAAAGGTPWRAGQLSRQGTAQDKTHLPLPSMSWFVVGSRRRPATERRPLTRSAPAGAPERRTRRPRRAGARGAWRAGVWRA